MIFKNDIKRKDMKALKASSGVNDIFEKIKNYPENIDLKKEDVLKKIFKLFNGSLEGFKYDIKNLSLDYARFNEKPLAFYWVATMLEKYGSLESINKFNVKDGEVVLRKTLDILFEEEDILVRANKVRVFLETKGIILRNSEFVGGSNVNACTINKKGQIFVFVNDKRKREYQYIFALVGELLSIYNKGDRNTARLIRTYEDKCNKSHHELDLAMEIFESDELMEMKWELLKSQTKKKVSFKNV